MEMSLRPMTEEDCEPLGVLDRGNPAGWDGDHFKAELKNPCSKSYVMTDDETDQEMIGFVVYHLYEQSLWIQNIGVAPSYRRHGVGQRLVQWVLREADRMVLKVGLEVRKSNEIAIQMYQKAGFVVLRTKKHFYSDGEDAYEMERDSTDPLPF